jgi:hypothetical protein
MDRVFVRLTLAIFAALAMSQGCSRISEASPGIVEGDYCNDVGSPRVRWSSEAKARTRGRVQAACEALGASPIICAYDDAIVWRESFGGEASVRHMRGVDADGTPEHGLGPMGLSLRWHADKWPGTDEDPAFCTPEVSVIVAHDIYRRAVTRYNATTIVEVQAVFAGRFRCHVRDRWGWLVRVLPVLASVLPEAERECWPMPTAGMAADVCERMAARGFNCMQRVTEADLGEHVLVDERRAWVLRQAHQSPEM